MSAVTGIFNRDNQPADGHVLDRMMSARAERGLDGQDSRLIGPVALGHQHFWLTPEEWGEKQPLKLAHAVISCDARLDNREQLGQLLGLDRKQARAVSDAALILQSYFKWGVGCLEHLLGDFAFLLWDEREKQLFLARDALGARDICYFSARNIFLAASEVSQILAHPGVLPRVNDNRIAALLAFVWDKPDESFYENIHYLPPAHGMIVSADQVKLWRYWDVDPDKTIRYRDETAYAEHYLALLEEAVRCRLRTVGPVGISLSGGRDSSALAAIAARMLPDMVPRQERLRSFSYIFDELHSCDERAYIKPMVERYDLQAVYLPCDDKWPLMNLDIWPASRDFVYADPFLWLPATVMEAAGKSGIRLLLGGYYGDTLFHGGRYWALDMMRRLRVGTLLRTLTANRATINWQQSLFEDGLRQMLPQKLAGIYRSWRPRTAVPYSAGMHPDLLARTDIAQRLAADGRVEGFTTPGQGHRYRALTLSVFSFGSAAGRHRYNQHGLELELPYYDRRLVEFVMAVPADELGRPNESRRIHNIAMQGLLPEAVRNRRDPTSFVPLRDKGLLDKERETIRHILADPQIVQRKYIDPDWLQQQKEKPLDLTCLVPSCSGLPSA